MGLVPCHRPDFTRLAVHGPGPGLIKVVKTVLARYTTLSIFAQVEIKILWTINLIYYSL